MRDVRLSPEGTDPLPTRFGLPPAPRRTNRTKWGTWLDALGLALLAAIVLWTYEASATRGRPWPVMALLLGCACALAAARLIGDVAGRWLVPAVVLVIAAGLAIGSEDLLSKRPLGGPFGYGNATGAFFVQAAAAALMLAASCRRSVPRVLALAVALAAALVPFRIGSVTAALLIIMVPAGLLVARWNRGGRAGVAACAVLFLAALSLTVWLGATYHAGDRSGPVSRLVDQTLTERRVVLWSEAFDIMRDHPWAGVGPGRFRLVSPTARKDVDAAWAHDEFLQYGAETGAPGFVLLVLAFLWAYARLGASGGEWPRALATLSLTALAIHASVDYVLHFPMIPLTSAALVGTGVATGRGR